MLYEKKMLILSGEGKGVVFIEKSAVGVKFSLRTFDMPPCGELRAGVITRSAVSVRDLPAGDNPAAVFSLDAGDISNLHFAVFDKKLRLYGCIGKRLWEANVMDLLCKADRRAPMTERVNSAPLPPIAPPPKVLPMPDGTGIPQSRLSLYGDEALAESDFYTPVDISARLRVVDNFLDTPRVFEELAPRVVPPEAEHAEKAEISVAGSEPVEYEEADVDAEDGDPTDETKVETRAETNVENVDISPSVQAEVAAAEPIEKAEPTDGEYMPWQREAQWLKRRSSRSAATYKPAVKPLEQKQTVRRVRESAFFELAREDIDKLFSQAEKDEKLSALLPDLEWVRVDADGNTISVGRGDDVLCYAVAGAYSKTPPLGDGSQWVPSDKNTPTGKGFWLIFQRLSDGTIVN